MFEILKSSSTALIVRYTNNLDRLIVDMPMGTKWLCGGCEHQYYIVPL